MYIKHLKFYFILNLPLLFFLTVNKTIDKCTKLSSILKVKAVSKELGSLDRFFLTEKRTCDCSF